MSTTKRSTWTWPLVLGASMAIGLTSALVGDGVWDVVGWIFLGAPLAVALFYAFRRA